jgi:protein TonB
MLKLGFIIVLFFAINIGYSSDLLSFSPPDSSMVYDFPEKMAQFPGGSNAMEAFIRKNLVYPIELQKAGIQGKVYMQFIVERDGSLTSIQVRRGADPQLDAEAIKVIEKMPNWIPGSMRGKLVRVKQTIPIVFSLSQ